jgi:hypothetical protein
LYRAKWGLAADYPMVCACLCAEQRRVLARSHRVLAAHQVPVTKKEDREVIDIVWIWEGLGIPAFSLTNHSVPLMSLIMDTKIDIEALCLPGVGWITDQRG